MGLSKRAKSLLHELKRSVDGVSLSDFAASEGISRRTAYYDISAINDALSREHAGSVSVRGGRIHSDDVDWAKVDEDARRSDDVICSAPERRAMILVYAALSAKRVTIGSLMDEFRVSRNTVIADVRDLKDRLALCDISFRSTAKDGYRIAGEEAVLRRTLWDFLRDVAGAACMRRIRSLLQSELVACTGEDIDFFELCRCLIKQYESDLGTRVFLSDNGLESTMIQASWLRSLRGSHVEIGDDERTTLMDTLSYRSIRRSAAKLAESGIMLPDADLLYMTSLLLGIKTSRFAGDAGEDACVAELAERLASDFERVGCLNYIDRPFVVKQMSHHIRPLYYRLKYGVQASNPLLDDIKRSYPFTYEFARRAAVCAGLEGLSEDEVAYLAIYLTAGLDRVMLDGDKGGAGRILVIGADGMSTIALIEQQICDTFGVRFEYECGDLRGLSPADLDRYVLVISLDPVPPAMEMAHVVRAEAVLAKEAVNAIFEVLRHSPAMIRCSALVEEVVGIVEKSLPVDAVTRAGESDLRLSLFRYFNECECSIPNDALGCAAPDLSHCACDMPVCERWQDAVLAGAAAIRTRTGSRSLLERMHNLLSSSRIQWYRMASDAVLVHCPMQGDEKGGVLTQAVVAGGGRRIS